MENTMIYGTTLFPQYEINFSRVWAMPNKATFKIKPIQKLLKEYVGDGKKWITQQGKTKFDCIVRAVKIKDNLVKIVADHSANNPMPYSYFWVEPSELNLKQSVSMPYYTKSEEEVCQHNKGL